MASFTPSPASSSSHPCRPPVSCWRGASPATPAWPGWSLYSSISGLLAFAFFAASIGPIPNAPIGLFQRLAIVTGWIWIALLAAHVLRQTRPPQPVGSM
jgi:hypothetical protein